MKKSVYEIATEKILEHLENGTIPWKKPWKTNNTPISKQTNKPYTGINRFLLSLLPFESPEYITYKQAQKLGGRIRKGSKSHPVFYFNFFEKEQRDKNGKLETVSIPFLRYYNVFNMEQTEGIDYKIPDPITTTIEPIESAEKILSSMYEYPTIQPGGGRAYYNPNQDYIGIPYKAKFTSAEEYYSTLYHEIIHSTGHKSRIDRKFGTSFGDHAYSKEELVAEFGATYLCSLAGIETTTIENSAAYIASWLKVLKNNSKWVVSAASQAEYAVKWLIENEKTKSKVA